MKNMILAILLTLSMSTYAEKQSIEAVNSGSFVPENMSTISQISAVANNLSLNNCGSVNSGCYTGWAFGCLYSYGEIAYCIRH